MADPILAWAEGMALQTFPGTSKGAVRKRKAFKYAATMAKRAIDLAAANPVVKRIAQVGDAAYATQTSAVQIYKKIEAGAYRADANGVIAVAEDAKSCVGSIVSLAQSMGLSQAAAQHIKDWTDVTTGCAMGIAATPIFGAIACGFSFLTKLFSVLGKSEFRLKAIDTPAIFTPNEESQPVIIADAVRLAQVLIRIYGQKSFTGLLKRVWAYTNPWLCDENLYPGKPPPGAQPSHAIPAHTMLTLLSMLDFDRGAEQAETNVAAGLQVLSAYRRSGCEPSGGRRLGARYYFDHDINVATIATGAFFARSAIAARGSTITKCELGPVWNSENRGSLRFSQQNVDWAPFMRLDELLNYFAAVTHVQLHRKDQELTKWHFGQYNPVRLVFVRTTDRSGIPPQDGGPSETFSQACWTNLFRGKIDQCHEADNRVYAGENRAVKEFAAMRLLAAMSYIHFHWRWTERGLALTREDLIAKVAQGAPADEFAELRMPVDPRQAVKVGSTWQLMPAEQPSVVVRRDYIANEAKIFDIVPAPIAGGGSCPRSDAATSPGRLMRASIARENELRDAIKAGEAAARGLTRPTLPIQITQETLQRFRERAAEVSLHAKPITALELQYVKPQSTTGLGPVLLIGGALLALKFLR